MRLELSYLYAKKGPDYAYTGTGHSGLGLPFMSEVDWSEKNVTLNASYEVFNDIFLFAGYSNSFIKDDLKIYSPEYFRGNTNTLNDGMNWGF